MAPKCSSEALWRAEANRRGRFRHAGVFNPKQLLRSFHPQAQNRLADRLARQRSPDPMEVKWGDRGGGGELRQ
jgi:hypothetical protein